MDDGYEVIGDKPPPKQARPVAKAVPKPKPPADEYEVIDEPPAKRPKPNLRRSLADDIDDEEDERPRKKGKKPLAAADKMASQLYGMLLVGLGVCMIVGFFLIGTAPRKLFMLLGAGGAGSLWTGIGLLIFPLPANALRAMKEEGGLGEFFKAMPGIWKVWFGLSIVVMAVAGYFVSTNLVPVGRVR